MSTQVRQELGFSTVELLISLFIAAAFIGTSFQLFSVVTEDSNKARLRAAAATIASASIQKSMGTATSPCGTPNPPATATTAVPTSELPRGSVTVTYTCPYGVNSRTTRITAAVFYGTPQEQVERSLDVTR